MYPLLSEGNSLHLLWYIFLFLSVNFHAFCKYSDIISVSLQHGLELFLLDRFLRLQVAGYNVFLLTANLRTTYGSISFNISYTDRGDIKLRLQYGSHTRRQTVQKYLNYQLYTKTFSDQGIKKASRELSLHLLPRTFYEHHGLISQWTIANSEKYITLW